AANGLSDQAYAVRIQALADNATDIIGPEYTRIDDWCCCHDNLGRLAPMRAISSRASRALLAGSKTVCFSSEPLRHQALTVAASCPKVATASLPMIMSSCFSSSLVSAFFSSDSVSAAKPTQKGRGLSCAMVAGMSGLRTSSSCRVWAPFLRSEERRVGKGG